MAAMRIDAHQHFWRRGQFDYKWMPEPPSPLSNDYLPSDLAPILERNRFEGSIAVQAAHDLAETRWLLELASQHPFIRGVVGWVDLTDARLGDTLDGLQRNPAFKGVRHMVENEPDPGWLLRDDVVLGLREIASRDLSYDLLILPEHLPVLRRLTGRVPGLRMVIDHLAKPRVKAGQIEGWAEALARAAESPNVYAKISGLITEADRRTWKSADLKPFVAHAYSVFGPQRLMFGSDWPVCLVAGSWKEVLAAFTQALGAASADIRDKLLGGTAGEFYRVS